MNDILKFNAEEARKLAESHKDAINMDDVKWVLQKIKFTAERGDFSLEVSKNNLTKNEIDYLEKKLGYEIENEGDWWIISWS